MSAREEIEAVIARMVAAVNEHDVEKCVALYTEDADLQDPRFPDPVQGKQYVREGFDYFFSAFPDARVEVVRRIVDAPDIAIEWTFEATHVGEYLGVRGSGVRYRVLTAAHFRVEDGKITRDFSLFDATGLKLLEENSKSAPPDS